MLNTKIMPATQLKIFLRTNFLIALVYLAITLGGCVSSSSYEEVSKERDELAKKQLAMESNTRYLRNTLESTEAKTARLQADHGGFPAVR